MATLHPRRHLNVNINSSEILPGAWENMKTNYNKEKHCAEE